MTLAEGDIRTSIPRHRLTPELVIQGYSLGVFPMARHRDAVDVQWVSPMIRGILPLDTFHVPGRLKKTIRRQPYRISVDHDFEGVIHACARPRDHRTDTWINNQIIRVFCQLHKLGYAHSVEAWRGGDLVGGLYGMALGGVFFGESMFSCDTDSSKIALVHLVALLKRGDFALLDTQFVTDHLRQFGAKEISGALYLRQLHDALGRRSTFYSNLLEGELDASVEAVLAQSSTQTS